MVEHWLNDEERAIFDAGLADIEVRIPREYGKSFDLLEPAQQLRIMQALENEATDSSWYELGNVQRTFISDAPFICQMKELTVWGFFTSEQGGTQVLRHNPMPMFFDGDIPLGPQESSWTSQFFF